MKELSSIFEIFDVILVNVTTVAGVKIGHVSTISLDNKSFQAKVTIRIFDSNFGIPEDSSVSILTAGILGEKYIGITPGGMYFNLEPDGVIEQTQSAVVLENLISKFLINTEK